MKRFIAPLLALCFFSSEILSREFPERPVRLVVPLPPGGATDVVARLLAQKLEAAWGQPVLLDHKPGGGTVIGAQAVATAAPDGHTLGIVISAFTINPTLRRDLPYDTLKDFAPVTQIGNTVMALVGTPEAPADLKALIAEAKKRPGALAYASLGVGTGTHLAGELLKMRAGIDLLHVPYAGSAPAYKDLLGGRVPLAFVLLQSALPHVKAGRLQVLGVTAARRSEAYPDYPALAEQLPGFSVDSMFGLVAPGATPKATVARIGADAAAALRDPALKAKYAELGMDAVGSTPEAFGAFLRAEIEKWAPVVRASGAKAD
jgi:tripartite-type tricarboxylate transporter receptor subunit TctC